jgi:hypothetical protein
VLWEKPKVVLLLVLFLACFQTSIDSISDGLMSPYVEDFERYTEAISSEGGPSKSAAQAALVSAITAKGPARLILSFLLSFLATPFLGFCLSKGALSLWDGIAPGPRDLWDALLAYPKSLVFFFTVGIYGIILFSISAAMFVPWFALMGRGGPAMVIGMILIILAGYLWGRFLWPVMRRFLFLQCFVYFSLSDSPRLSGFFRTTLELDRRLRYWPSHLNHMAAYAFLAFILLFMATGMIMLLLSPVGPDFVPRLVGQYVILLGFLWLTISIAGFYRLCLNPPEEPAYAQEAPPQYRP